MGSIIGVLIAFISVVLNDQIYQLSPSNPPGPLVSSYLFVTALFLLLCEIRVYPTSLRKLGTVPQAIIEMFIAAFIGEIIILDFWFPLEATAMDQLDKTADLVDELLSSGHWNCDRLCDVLRSNVTRFLVSYTLSTFFLITVLHATRGIDLRALDDGMGCFFGDIIFRLKRNVKKQIKSFTAGKNLEDMSEGPGVTIVKELITACSTEGPLEDKNESSRRTQQRETRRSSRRRRKTHGDGDKSNDGDKEFRDFLSDIHQCSSSYMDLPNCGGYEASD